MNKKAKSAFAVSAVLFLLFAVFTVLVKVVDVRPIGPLGTEVGFSAFNGKVQSAIGENPAFASLSEVFGYLAILCAVGFALLGLFQVISRKSLFKADRSLYVLAAFYVLVLGFYILFEVLAVNGRPIVEDGAVEASYPSSHTVLTLTFFLSAVPQLKMRLPGTKLTVFLNVVLTACAFLGEVTRFLSGVHWASDILGGLLLSGALLFLYFGALLCLAVPVGTAEGGAK